MNKLLKKKNRNIRTQSRKITSSFYKFWKKKMRFLHCISPIEKKTKQSFRPFTPIPSLPLTILRQRRLKALFCRGESFHRKISCANRGSQSARKAHKFEIIQSEKKYKNNAANAIPNESETAARKRTPQISCSHEKYANSKIDTHHRRKRGAQHPTNNTALKWPNFVRHWHWRGVSHRGLLAIAGGFGGSRVTRAFAFVWSIWRAFVVWQLVARAGARVRRALQPDANWVAQCRGFRCCQFDSKLPR